MCVDVGFFLGFVQNCACGLDPGNGVRRLFFFPVLRLKSAVLMGPCQKRRRIKVFIFHFVSFSSFARPVFLESSRYVFLLYFVFLILPNANFSDFLLRFPLIIIGAFFPCTAFPYFKIFPHILIFPSYYHPIFIFLKFRIFPNFLHRFVFV